MGVGGLETSLLLDEEKLSPPTLRPIPASQVCADDEELGGHCEFRVDVRARDLSLHCASGVVGNSTVFVGKQGRTLGVLGTWWCCVHHGLCVPVVTCVRRFSRCSLVRGLRCDGAAASVSHCRTCWCGTFFVSVSVVDPSKVFQICTYFDVPLHCPS